MKRKPNLLHIFIGVDIVLGLLAVIIFGYLFTSVRMNRNTVQAATTPHSPHMEPETISSSAPTPPPVPAPSPTPEPFTVYETEQFRFSYDSERLTLSDRSGEVGQTAIALTVDGENLPRLDIQVLEDFPAIFGQEDFRMLARIAVQAYFAESPVEILENSFVMEETQCTAELSVPATEASPALEVSVRLIRRGDHGVLAMGLAQENTANQTALQEVLGSLVCY